MSFSGTISNALSGLRASSLAAELVSSNLANATNEDYATRRLDVSSRVGSGTGGVQVDGVTRLVDPALLDEWRRAHSESSEFAAQSGYLTRVERLFGAPDDVGSLNDLLTRFDTSLVAAATRPDLPQRLQDVLSKAQTLAAEFGSISAGIQALRSEIDAEISREVEDLNTYLDRIADLNKRIAAAHNSGSGTASLQDLRQAAVDSVAEIVPVRIMNRDHGEIALVTMAGTVLLDGNAAEFEFDRTAIVTEHLTIQNGLLSGLTVNGSANSLESDPSHAKGGRLAALFGLRDDTMVRYQSEIDALARNVVERFQDSSLDPTIGIADAGLFTDRGTAFDAADETGIARRLAINTQADPANGGELWRLRDGLYAAAQGPVGNGDLLLAMNDRLRANLTVASGSQAGSSYSILELTSTLLSTVGGDLTRVEERQTFAAARGAELTEQKLRAGVDSDTELQKLMQIEKAYAANAQVLRTVDEMLDTLLRI